MSEHVETLNAPVQGDEVIDLTEPVEPAHFAPNPMAIEMPNSVAAAPSAPTIVPNPMAIEEPAASNEPVEPAVATATGGALTDAPIDAFDADHHKGILDRLEHELALVDAALAHIDDDELDAAETAIKELARHNDDGQVALPLR